MTPEPDVESFQRLYAANVDPVLGYALRRVGTPADAAGAVADRTDAVRALSQLGEADREVVELTAWEGPDSRGRAGPLHRPGRPAAAPADKAELAARLGE